MKIWSEELDETGQPLLKISHPLNNLEQWILTQTSLINKKFDLKVMEIKLKPIIDMMMDDLFCTRNHPFKIELEHPQPHNRGKVNLHTL